MDRYPDRVPIQTQKVGSIYNDKVYYELLSSINSINGRPCEGEVRKDMLHDGDYVTYTFRSKEFSGVVMAAGLQTLEPPNPAQPQEQQNAASKQQVQESSPPQQPAKDILRTASGRKITKRSPAKHSSQAPEKSPAKHSSTATEKSPSKRSSTENKKGKSPVKLSSTAHSPPAKRARTGQSTASKKSLKKGRILSSAAAGAIAMPSGPGFGCGESTATSTVSEAGLKVFMQQVLNHLDQLSQSVISCTNEVNRTSRLLELEVKNHSRFLELELKNVSHKIEQEIRSLRNRQDIIVNKQDQIQSTLHGDTPAFQSPPLTYMHSPAFTSPTSSVVGNRMSAGPQTTQSAQSELSSLLDESDLESFLSFDWGEPTIQTTPHCDNVQRAGTSRHCTTTALPQYGQGATSILFTPEQYGQQATSATSILSPNEQYVTAAGATGAKEKADRADGTAAAKVAGIGMLSGKHGTGFPSHTWVKPEVPMCGQKFTTGTPVLKHGTPAAMPQCSPASAGTSQETETSTTTVTPHRTTEALLKDPERVLASYDSINEKDVGKITRILASQAIFGIGVLRQSTVRGDKKRGLAPLDPTKISTLLSIIHHHRSFIQLSKAEFDEVTKKKILPSLSHYCKELRNRT